MNSIDLENKKCPICSYNTPKDSVNLQTCRACNWFNDNADVIYMLVPNNAEWEDLILYKNKEDAIAASIKYYKNTIQIFKKKEGNGYEPSYLYYINGKLQSNI
jgi:hypothetical protein